MHEIDRTRLGIGWQLFPYTGWGVFGINLARQFLARGLALPVPLVAPELGDAEVPVAAELRPALEAWYELGAALARHPQGEPFEVRYPVLHGLGNDLIGSAELQQIRGAPDFGMVFFEDTRFSPASLAQGRSRFRRILAGSSWNAEVLRARGLSNVSVCLQGIDTSVFFPRPKTDAFPGRFVVFSGGKLEYRKGQDLVIAAFREFHAQHPDALLVAAWHNFWPASVGSLARSPYVRGVPGYDESGQLRLAPWLAENGLPEGSFIALPPLPNARMAEVYRELDVALFPNRAEGGTNLVAMECLASGVFAILSNNTGHLDLIGATDSYALEEQVNVVPVTREEGVEGWGESSVEEIVMALEWTYANREAARASGEASARSMANWDWGRQAAHLHREIFAAL
ncbi:MAG: glycosyltransferase [Betaproteobacteria bacterium]|nr:glycosyltransferase [Betaproteobacteria bacterium]